MEKKIILILTLFFSYSLEAKIIQFSQLISLLERDNDSLQAKIEQAEALRSKLGHRGRSFIPNLQIQLGKESYKGEYDRQSQYFAGIEAELNLFRGGRDSLLASQMESSHSKAEKEVEKHKLLLLYHTKTIYRQIQGLLKKQILHQQYIKELEKIETASDKRVRSKVAQASETLRVKYEILKAKGHAKEMMLSVDEYKTQLAVLLGLEEHKNIIFDDFVPKPNNEWTSLDEKFENHPDLKILEKQKELLDSHLKQKSGWRIGELSLYSHYGRPALSAEEELARLEKNEFTLGLRFKIPISDLFHLNVDRKSHDREIRSLDFQKRYALNEKQALDHEIRHDLAVTNDLWQQNKQEKILATQIFKAAFLAYEKGAQSTSEIQESLEIQLDALKREVDLLTEYSVKLSRLEYLNP